MTLALRPQELPLDHPQSRHFFQPGPEKPLVATPGVRRLYTRDEIAVCLRTLQEAARAANGLEYGQAFDSDEHAENLCFIEDHGEGAITALLPSEY